MNITIILLSIAVMHLCGSFVIVLDFVIRNQDNIILGFIFMLMGVAIGPLISSILGKKEDRSISPMTLSQIVYIDKSTTINNPLPARSQATGNDDMAIFYIVIFASCLGYIYWRHEILLTLTSISLFSIGMFIGTAIYAYANDSIDGAGWTWYLIFTSAISIFSFVLIAGALAPTYAPSGLNEFQNIFRQQHLPGLIKAMGSIDALTWMITHVMGVFLLFYIHARVSLSLAHYLAVMRLGRSINHSRIAFWLATKTHKYRNPILNAVSISFLSVISYILINGYAYVWYTHAFARIHA